MVECFRFMAETRITRPFDNARNVFVRISKSKSVSKYPDSVIKHTRHSI